MCDSRTLITQQSLRIQDEQQKLFLTACQKADFVRIFNQLTCVLQVGDLANVSGIARSPSKCEHWTPHTLASYYLYRFMTTKSLLPLGDVNIKRLSEGKTYIGLISTSSTDSVYHLIKRHLIRDLADTYRSQVDCFHKS